MTPLGKLRTQDEAFWRDVYEVSPEDLDVVTALVLEKGGPLPIEALSEAVIRQRFEQERRAVREVMSETPVYRPMDSYREGDRLLFSAFDLAEARVVGVRPGYNPKYGSFSVIRVVFEGTQEEREFAADFDCEHPLNRPPEELVRVEDADISIEEVIATCSPYVVERLEAELAQDDEWVEFDGLWFISGLLPEVHVGHLNLAEAMIYEANRPLLAEEMVNVLELEGSRPAQIFALNRALAEDERFDNLGTAIEPLWYLRALEPVAVQETPPILVPMLQPSKSDYIGFTMVEIVEALGDEWDTMPMAGAIAPEQVQLSVIFPHLYLGTLPAGYGLLKWLKGGERHHFRVQLVDEDSGQTFEGWVVPGNRYIAGLDDWYRENKIFVGAEITVKPGDQENTLILSLGRVRRTRREWLRIARVEGNEIFVELRQGYLPVRCDRNMQLDVEDPDAVFELMNTPEVQALTLKEIMQRAFDELAKLNPQGAVHCKALYALINMYRRVSAVSVFAELTRNAAFDPVGDGFWAYTPELEGKVYHTPEEMRERPLSQRGDRIRDQAIVYLAE